ncbi:MAG: hypothetical protein ABII00_07040 [Elusimicrobiota bacterium]
MASESSRDHKAAAGWTALRKTLSHTALRSAASADGIGARRLFDGDSAKSLGASFAVPATKGWSPVSGRKLSAVPGVSFADGVSEEHKALFEETLRRRKASWYRSLADLGVRLNGPLAPTLTVRAAKEAAHAGGVAFTVDWEQGPTHLGSFQATVQRRDAKARLRRLPPPPAPEEKQITMRFNKSIMVDVGGLNVEQEVGETHIAEFLESQGLRLLNKNWQGYYTVAVTGEASADAVAWGISGRGIVLYATPLKADIPKEDQLIITFKETTVMGRGPRVAVRVEDRNVAEALRTNGLQVLESDRDGTYRVGVKPGVSAAETAARLSAQGIVLFATPVQVDIAEDRQVILKFEETVLVNGISEASVSDDDVAGVLREHGLTVLADFDERTYKVAGPAGVSGIDLAKRLSAIGLVGSAVAVGSVTQEEIDGAVRSAVSQKGRPWSESEYSAAYYMTKRGLTLRGATRAQLEEYAKRCDEAPVRGGGFNPWSGD